MGRITLRSRLQNVGITGTQLYVTKPLRYSTIGIKEIVKYIRNDSGVPSAMALASVQTILQQIEQLLLNGHSIQLGVLGTIRLSANIKAGKKPEDVKGSNLRIKRWRILFEPSVELTKEMQATKFNLEIEDGNGNVLSPKEVQAIIEKETPTGDKTPGTGVPQH